LNLKQMVAGIAMAGAFIAASMLVPSVGYSQDAKVKAAMELLRSKADKLGPPKTEGLILWLARKCLPSILARPK
jgi:hypothetical protein